MGFLGVFMGFLEVKPEIFRMFLEKFRKDLRPFFGVFVARPKLSNLQLQ